MSGADDEYTSATPEHVLVFPPGTVFTEAATASEQFFREYHSVPKKECHLTKQ
jgi:hypothetical protein